MSPLPSNVILKKCLIVASTVMVVSLCYLTVDKLTGKYESPTLHSCLPMNQTVFGQGGNAPKVPLGLTSASSLLPSRMMGTDVCSSGSQDPPFTLPAAAIPANLERWIRNSMPNFSYTPKSCSCPKGTSTLSNRLKLDEIELQQRAQQYKSYLIRKRSVLNQFLLAPANSPLQYPIQGFIVRPLQKSIIPGLSVHSAQKENYQVALSVSRGVLAVESLQQKDQVKGQNEMALSISASSLQSLNDLLGRVSYRSTVYSIKSGDLVHFTFEEHTAIFPIVIRQLTVPVLHAFGADIESQVTITTKTFLRYDKLNDLIQSIRMFYKDIKIIIADDNFNQSKVEGSNIEQYFMPPAQGWFAGRNLAVSQVTTKYFVWVDDDNEFSKETKIETMVEIMESMPELDVVGGLMGNQRYDAMLLYEEGDEDGGCLRQEKGTFHPIPGLPNCTFTSMVANFFLARTDSVRKVGFDPLLRRVGHTEFFIDGLGELLVANCPWISVKHQTKKGRPVDCEYCKFRYPPTNAKSYVHFIKNHLKCFKH